jgi:hypothetical protein
MISAATVVTNTPATPIARGGTTSTCGSMIAVRTVMIPTTAPKDSCQIQTVWTRLSVSRGS